MKKFLLILAAISSLFSIQGQVVIKTNVTHIPVFVNDRKISWTIDPDTKPDRLVVYCSKTVNSVKFRTDIDSVSFSVRKSDTISLNIVVKSGDTACTEIIGIKDLPDKILPDEKLYWFSLIWA